MYSRIERLPERIQAVRKFTWNFNDKNCQDNLSQLLKDLEDEEEFEVNFDNFFFSYFH